MSEITSTAKMLDEMICKFIKSGLPTPSKTPCLSAMIKFSLNEIDLMLQPFKKEFIANGCVAHIIKRPSGKNGCYYEIRYRRNGYNISVSNKNLKRAKNAFINQTKQHCVAT